MIGIFDDILSKKNFKIPLLGVCHTTKDSKENHENIIAAKKLQTSLCDKYHEQLLYMFYGKPAYKLPKYPYPMCFVFESDEWLNNRIKRKVAFDSGAFIAGKMKEYFNELEAQIEQFYLYETSAEVLSKFVDCFFGNNKSYFDGIIKTGETIYNNELINRYLRMLKDNLDSKLDDRRKTIELQINSNIDMSVKKPELLVLTSAFVQNRDKLNHLEETLGCKIKLIDQTESGNYYDSIYTLVRNHFETKKLLQ